MTRQRLLWRLSFQLRSCFSVGVMRLATASHRIISDRCHRDAPFLTIGGLTILSIRRLRMNTSRLIPSSLPSVSKQAAQKRGVHFGTVPYIAPIHDRCPLREGCLMEPQPNAKFKPPCPLCGHGYGGANAVKLQHYERTITFLCVAHTIRRGLRPTTSSHCAPRKSSRPMNRSSPLSSSRGCAGSASSSRPFPKPIGN